MSVTPHPKINATHHSHRLKDKTYMIIATEAFDKIYHSHDNNAGEINTREFPQSDKRNKENSQLASIFNTKRRNFCFQDKE